MIDHPLRLVLLGHVGGDGRRLAAGRRASAAADSAISSVTSTQTTRAPSAANIRAAVRPIPPPAPVMIVTLSSRRTVDSLPQDVDVAAGSAATLGRDPLARCGRWYSRRAAALGASHVEPAANDHDRAERSRFRPMGALAHQRRGFERSGGTGRSGGTPGAPIEDQR